MQAILTRYLPPTATRSARIKATCDRGSLTLPAEFSSEQAHIQLVTLLIGRFCGEDEKTYGTKPCQNPWNGRRAVGCLSNGSYVHVFIA